MGFGEQFKEAREIKGLSLEAVEEETKIRKLYLQAIEDEEFDVLPPQVYAVGFVKRYAKILGLNEKQMAEEFKNIAYSTEPEEELVINRKVVEHEKRFSLTSILAGLVFLVIAVWIGNYLVGYFAQQGTDNVSPPPELPSIEEPKEKESPPQDEKPGEVYNGVNLLIEARQKCWLLIVVDGKEEFNAILNAGESKTFAGNEKIYLKAGNAGGIDITFNGEKIESLGNIGEVKDKTFSKEEISD